VVIDRDFQRIIRVARLDTDEAVRSIVTTDGLMTVVEGFDFSSQILDIVLSHGRRSNNDVNEVELHLIDRIPEFRQPR
jgi:hypothetical protein